MSGWLSQFKLGRPGHEYQFTANPESIDITEAPVAAEHRNLAGDLKRSILKASAPVIKIASSYLPKADRDRLASLCGVADTLLSFQTRDDWQVTLEQDYPTTTTSVIIQNTSATRLAAQLVANGFASSVTIAGVFDNPDGTGTNYYTAGVGGSYAAATRTITLGSALAGTTNPVYVTYTYTGWLVVMRQLQHRGMGGWMDRFQYDFELVGA